MNVTTCWASMGWSSLTVTGWDDYSGVSGEVYRISNQKTQEPHRIPVLVL